MQNTRLLDTGNRNHPIQAEEFGHTHRSISLVLLQGALLTELLQVPLRLASIGFSLPPGAAPEAASPAAASAAEVEPASAITLAAATALERAVNGRAVSTLAALQLPPAFAGNGGPDNRGPDNEDDDEVCDDCRPGVCVVAAPSPALGLSPGNGRRVPSGKDSAPPFASSPILLPNACEQ